MTGIVNSTGARSGVIGTTVGTPAAGGITQASQWRMTANLASAGSYLTSNWEEDLVYGGIGRIGTIMGEASGVFTFPTTGYWLVRLNISAYDNGNRLYAKVAIYVDSGSGIELSSMGQQCLPGAAVGGSNAYGNVFAESIIDITNVSTCFLKFYVISQSGSINWIGEPNSHATYATFIRLGDT